VTTPAALLRRASKMLATRKSGQELHVSQAQHILLHHAKARRHEPGAGSFADVYCKGAMAANLRLRKTDFQLLERRQQLPAIDHHLRCLCPVVLQAQSRERRVYGPRKNSGRISGWANTCQPDERNRVRCRSHRLVGLAYGAMTCHALPPLQAFIQVPAASSRNQ